MVTWLTIQFAFQVVIVVLWIRATDRSRRAAYKLGVLHGMLVTRYPHGHQQHPEAQQIIDQCDAAAAWDRALDEIKT
jgi:hypothetical protein